MDLAFSCKTVCNKPWLNRPHLTCAYCRWRKKLKGWKPPKRMVYYMLPWSSSDAPQELMIDPRGRFVFMRCCIAVAMVEAADKIWNLGLQLHLIVRSRKTPFQKFCMAPFVNIAEMVSAVTL